MLMQPIKYMLHNFKHVSWMPYNPYLDLQLLEDLAGQYVTLTGEFPDRIFLSHNLNREFLSGITISDRVGFMNNNYEPQPLVFHLATGPVLIKVVRRIDTAEEFILVGKEIDYARYDLDRNFEDIVLKD